MACAKGGYGYIHIYVYIYGLGDYMSRGTRDIERGGERKTGGGTICHMRKFMHVSALIPQRDMNGGGEGLLYIMCLAARVCVCAARGV